MAIAFVSGTTKQNNGNFTTTAIDTRGADLIILSLSCSKTHGPGLVASISDSKTNTWLNTGGIYQADGSNNAESTFVYCLNPTTDAAHTFSTTGAGSILQSMCVGAYSGANNGLDSVHSGGSSLAAFTVQPGSVTPNQNNSLIFVVGTAVQIAPTLSVNQSFTIRENQPLVAGQTYGSWIMDLFQGTAAAVNPTITSNMNSNGMGALAYVFKGAPDVALTGVSGTAAAGTLSAGVVNSVALTGVSGTAAVGSFSIAVTSSFTLAGTSATAAAGSFVPGISPVTGLTGISATAAAGTFALAVTSNFALVGVQATASAGTLYPTQVLVTVPMITIMNDLPIPVEGDMADDDVPMEGDMPYQLAFESVINTNPIPMSGAMSADTVPGEGSVP